MAEQTELKTNHNVRVVNLTTGQNVLCIFGEIRSEDEEKRVVGYRLVYPFTLSLDTPNEDGTIPIQYARFCPYSPVEEHRMGGEHIMSVVYPENGILDNYVTKLKEYGVGEDQLFFEVENGSEGEPAETAE